MHCERRACTNINEIGWGGVKNTSTKANWESARSGLMWQGQRGSAASGASSIVAARSAASVESNKYGSE